MQVTDDSLRLKVKALYALQALTGLRESNSLPVSTAHS